MRDDDGIDDDLPLGCSCCLTSVLLPLFFLGLVAVAILIF